MQDTPNEGPQYNMRFLWMICLVAAMGGLLFGYDWVVIGGAKPFYEPFFGIYNKPLLQGWAMSSALVGCLFGAVVSGALSDRFGRRRLLILAGLLFTFSAVGTGLSWSFTWFNVFRWIGGVGIGLASSLSPMYIAEISPAHMRGRFVSINQLTIVIGILAAQVVNLTIAQQVPTADQLRLLASSDDVVRTVYADDFNIDKERDKAAALTDVDAFRAVREKFPDLAVVKVAKSDKEAVKHKQAQDAAVMAAYILPTWNGRQGWRWMFAAETVLPLDVLCA
jgi:hypothetical protein